MGNTICNQTSRKKKKILSIDKINYSSNNRKCDLDNSISLNNNFSNNNINDICNNVNSNDNINNNNRRCDLDNSISLNDNFSSNNVNDIYNNVNSNNNNYNNFNNNNNNNFNNNNDNNNNNNRNSIDEKSLKVYNKNDNRKFVFNGPKSYNLIVHRNDGMNDFIIEMTLTKFDKNNIKNQLEFIMILDVSGSMSGHVHKLVSVIIPKGLNLLNYSDNNIIHLITFQSYVNYYKKTIGELKNDSSLEGSGGTYMANVYEKVEEILNNSSNGNNFRILVLSDGMIADQERTADEEEKIKQYIINNNNSISVSSIRYNSGYGEPDTRASSSVLRLNTDNSKTRVLTEVSSSDSNESISQKIYELFKNDYFQSDFSIQSDKIKFRIDPWNEGSNKVKLNEGKNIFFSDKNPTLEDVGIYENGQLKYKKDDFKNGYKLTYSNYNALLGAKIKMTSRKVRINKTSGSKEALEENKKIINYFENFEKKLEGNENKKAIVAKE